MVEGYDWVFIDTAPTMWVVVQEAIRAATLVLVPARPAFFDLDAVLETVKTARERDKPYAVVLNAAPSKRDDKEAPVVAQSRAFLDQHGVPVWHGQISQRAGYSLHARGRRERLRAGARDAGGGRDRRRCGRRSSVRSRRSTPPMRACARWPPRRARTPAVPPDITAQSAMRGRMVGNCNH